MFKIYYFLDKCLFYGAIHTVFVWHWHGY
jgi:hypothetical protein